MNRNPFVLNHSTLQDIPKKRKYVISPVLFYIEKAHLHDWHELGCVLKWELMDISIF